MDGSSSMERINQEHRKIILIGFITYEDFKCKALRTKLFEGEYYVITQGGHI
jgi:anaerobic glycerol-3-phosphate dehydrogenase